MGRKRVARLAGSKDAADPSGPEWLAARRHDELQRLRADAEAHARRLRNDQQDALAHGEREIARTLGMLATIAEQQARIAEMQPAADRARAAAYRHRQNPGGRPSIEAKAKEWLRAYEAKRAARLTAVEAWEDVAQEYRERTGTAHHWTYIRKKACEIRRRQKTQV